MCVHGNVTTKRVVPAFASTPFDTAQRISNAEHFTPGDVNGVGRADREVLLPLR